MGDLEELDRRVRETLAAAAERRQLVQDHLRQRMSELEQRHQRFVGIAEHLLREVVRPRFEHVLGYFENAEPRDPVPEEHPYSCSCRLRHCDRFPATGELSLVLSHDQRIENLLVIYHLEILPIFFQFVGQDQVVFPLDDVDETKVAAWIDDRLIAFVETYLHLELGEQYQAGNLVTDPVCGMRINKHYATSPVEDRGRLFYFCTEGCRAKFLEAPHHYVSAATP
jgi:YHS domain-containing protein